MLMDPRVRRLADLLVNHSVRTGKGDHVLIETFDCPDFVAAALVEHVQQAGGHAHVAQRSSRVMRALNLGGEDALRTWGDYDRERMKRMQCYIGVRGADNASEMSGMPESQMKTVGRLYNKPVHFDQRVNHTRWCVLRWPSASMAQLAQSSTESFEDFYFRVCTLDYARMTQAAMPLVERMKRTDQVHIKGPGPTDLRFSIKGIGVVPCCGDRNIPDGEVFTAPVRDSVEGVLQYNTPTLHNGNTFTNIRLEFKKGRIVKTGCDGGDPKLLESIFDTDEGARHIGEFAIGFHPHIREAMKDILFDEKIAGSFHFTPGRCYEETENGNRSEIHWDLVCIQRPEYGGGTISVDGEVIRKDGIFVAKELEGLNPEHLGAL